MKPGMGWPIGVAVILGATVAANIVVMRLASSDPSFAIEPDYYKKAVAFDSTMAAESRSLTLGWSATSTIVANATSDRPVVSVTLVDSLRQPIVGATVTITALANARANEVLSATLRESAPGRYDGTLAATFAGQWEVRVNAVRGAQHFTSSTRTDVARATRDTAPAPDTPQHGGDHP